MLEILEQLSIIRFFTFTVISIFYKLNSKFNYLFLIELFCILSLNSIFKPIKFIASVILMSGIYGTINDIIYGWLSPEYWRENHSKDLEFPLKQSNIDKISRPIHHAFFWGFYATWKFSVILAIPTTLIAIYKNINIDIFLDCYLKCFLILFGLSLENFKIAKDLMEQNEIPKYLNYYSYIHSFFLNKIIILYFLYK